MLVIKKHTREHRKRNINLFFFTVDFYHFILSVIVIKSNAYFAGLTRDLIGGNFLAIERVGDSHAYGQFFFNIAPIVNIVALCIPNLGVSADCVGLIALYVFNIGKPGGIGNGSTA